MQYTNECSGSEGRFFRNRTIGGVSMENDALPQYMRIARSIAQRIADGELMEGEKLSGRSKLSSEYNVSPETIRKAVQVLQDRAVVIVREQSGVYVLSAELARQCLAGFKDGGGLIGKKHRLRQLLEQQQALGRELQELCGSILDEMILPAQAAQSLPNYCVRIPEDWDGAGRSLGELKFWRATGATVVAIRRSITSSPHENSVSVVSRLTKRRMDVCTNPCPTSNSRADL